MQRSSCSPVLLAVLALRLARAAPLAPALEVPLPPGRDRDRVLRHGLGDRRAGGHEGARLKHERRDQVRIAADADALADRGAMLLLPVVVHRDGAAAEGGARTDVCI